LQIVKENPHIPWYYDNLSKNPNITWENIQSNSESRSDAPQGHNLCKYLSANTNITYQIVKANPHFSWDFRYLSQNNFNHRKYNWNKKLHKYYSKKIKGEIMHLIWCWKQDNILNKIPKDILYKLISIIY